MKIAILGGGAPSTPGLFEYFDRQLPRGRIEAVLVGPTEEHLRAVARACLALSANPGLTVEAVATGSADWPRAMAGADIVLLQARVGGMAGRAADEAVPLRFGVPGDSTVGVGGASSAWRAWPLLQPYLQEVERWSPDATVVVMTSPVGILVRLARRSSPSLTVMGVCELPASVLQQQASKIGIHADQLTHDYIGVNHLGWLHNLRYNGGDLLPTFIRAAGSTSVTFPDGACLAMHEAIPTPHWTYILGQGPSADQAAASALSRTKRVAKFQQAAHGAFATGDSDAIRNVLRERHAPWYPMAIGPLLLGLAGRPIRETLYLSMARPEVNRDMGLEADDVLELPYRSMDGTLRASRGAKPIAELPARLVAAQVRYERAVAESIWRRDTAAMAAAIAHSPWRPSDGRAIEPLVGELLGRSTAPILPT